MRSKTISVQKAFPHDDQYEEVDAYLVGGTDGVFAIWTSERPDSPNDLIHIAAGDDGHWWELTTFDVFWLNPLVQIMNYVNNQYVTKDAYLVKRAKHE